MDRLYSEAIDIIYKNDVPGNDRRLLHEILKVNPQVIVDANTIINGPSIEERILECAGETNSKIKCIKLYRELTFASLKDAKEAIERICDEGLFD